MEEEKELSKEELRKILKPTHDFIDDVLEKVKKKQEKKRLKK